MTVAICLLIGLYLLPTLIAFSRKANPWPAVIVDLLLGWSFIGWVVALAMAASGTNEKAAVRQQTLQADVQRWQQGGGWGSR
jgi:hypothetical protein